MLNSNNYNYSLFTILFNLLASNYMYSCAPSPSELGFIDALAGVRFSTAVATWYGSPTGAGSGGASGLENDVQNAPHYGLISAGNSRLFRGGVGCGTCYLVKCNNHTACSGYPVSVTITDECPGACNNEAFHFDLSGKAFGSLAKRGQDNLLRNAGRINIQYARVACHYKAYIAFKIDAGSNKYYLSFAVENVNGDGEIHSIEILPSRGATWTPMQRVWGQTWKFDVHEGVSGPYSVRLHNLGRTPVVAARVIPANWAPRKTYYSRVNFA